MNLENALNKLNDKNNDKDILELLGIVFLNNYSEEKYYSERIKKMHIWDYFISDLDGTFFRWVLQKEAFSLFVKFVKKQKLLDLDLDKYYEFLTDLKFFDALEKKAYNKEIEYFEYLNAWIYLMIKHKNLVSWDDYIIFVKNNFKYKEKITPFRFSFQKMQEILMWWWNFVFVSWAPNFIFDIYLELLKEYVWKNIGFSYANNVFWFWSYVDFDKYTFTPLWWREHKKSFINNLIDLKIINKTLWWMWDTSSDFWISYSLDKWNDFYFVNPEKKVIINYEEFKIEWINYHNIIERKDLIFEINKKDINII